jgi:hypothetical protein
MVSNFDESTPVVDIARAVIKYPPNQKHIASTNMKTTFEAPHAMLLDFEWYSFLNLFLNYITVCRLSRPTVCVSRKWAGADSAGEPEKNSKPEKAQKTRRVPLVGCTLCWAVF